MNIIEGIQAQCNRLRDELIPQYEEIGGAGKFGIALMRAAIAEGEAAIASGDAIRMIHAHKELEEFRS